MTFCLWRIRLVGRADHFNIVWILVFAAVSVGLVYGIDFLYKKLKQKRK